MKVKITGLPKYQQRPGTVGDDDWIRKILEYEASKGSATGTGLSNWGYNNWQKFGHKAAPSSIDEAIQYYKQDYLPQVSQYPMGLRERMGDYIYNTGRNANDLLLYNAGKISLDQLNSPNTFTNEWNQFGADIQNMYSNPNFINKLDESRDAVYRTTKQVNGKPNPAYDATWKGRLGIFPKFGAPQSNDGANPMPTVGKPAQSTSPVAKTDPPGSLFPQGPTLNITQPAGAFNIWAPTADITGKIFEGAPKPSSIDATDDFNINPELLKKIGTGIKAQQQKRQIASKDNIPDAITYDSKGNRVGEWKNEQYIADPAKKETPKAKKTPVDNSYGMAAAGLMNTGLSFIGNTIQGIQEEQDLGKFNRKYGQTDAGNPVVKNVYSRGRNVMNTGEYAPNQMTPVQFAGRPVSEYVGYPTFPYNVYAQDGLSVSEDVLGLPTLFSDPSMYAELDPASMPSVPAGGGSGSPDVSAAMSGNFALPVKDFKITSGFGHRAAPIKGASTEHNGVDLAVPENTAVFSPMDGVVEKIYSNDKGGKQLIIRHADGSKSGYAHLNGYNVAVGDNVTKGQRVALSGNTGNSSGAHLHFTFRNPSGSFIDPIDFFNMRGTRKSRYEAGLSNWDHNNPGNIHIEGKFAGGYGAVQGRKDGSGHVAVFPTMESGLKAMQDLIFSPSYSNLTISQARNKWVNGSPSQPTSSTSHIVKAIGADIPLNQLNSQQRKILLSEFIKWEDRNVYDKLQKQGYFEQGGTVPNNNTSMKIKITGTPNKQEFADGGKTVGDQMGYGLYRGQAVRDFNAFNKEDEDNYDANVISTETAVPRQDANIEAEDGEKIIAPNLLSIMDIKGKKHSGGGVPMDAEPGSYIVSDFIVAPKDMQAAMGFEIPSNKKKDNTWARVLDSKVKSKDFNKLSQIIQAASSGKEVDPFELAMAKSKLPIYQEYVSKAALGNELTKMMMDKPYEIPQIAMPAMVKMFPEMAQQMMGQPTPGGAEPNGGQQFSEGQQPMAKYGLGLPRFATAGTVDDKPIKIKNKSEIAKYEKEGYKRIPGTNTWRKTTSGSESKPAIVTPGVKGTPGRAAIPGGAAVTVKTAVPGGKAGKSWEQWIQSQLAKGVTIDELVAKGHGTKEGLGKYRSYYKPVTEGKPAVAEIPDVAEKIECPTGYEPDPNDPKNCIKKKETVDEFTYEDPGDDGGEFEYEGGDFGKPPYVQDILNFGNAAANQFAYPTIGPFRARYNSVYMDPAFVSTEGVDRLIQSQGRTAMEDASLYAGAPQVQSARQTQIAQQVLPSMLQNRVQTNQQNVGSDMGTRQFNTQIANQAGMMDAQITSQLAEDNARLAMNRAKEKIAGRTATKNMLNQMITNAGDTSLMNQWYPQYAFNPLDYGTYFKKGKGKGLEDQATTDASTFSDNLAAAKQYAASIGITSGKELNEAIMDYLEFSTGKPSRKTANPYARGSRVSPSFNDGTQTQQVQQQRSGGFIPIYFLGGWY